MAWLGTVQGGFKLSEGVKLMPLSGWVSKEKNVVKVEIVGGGKDGTSAH
jgi:hypothetical protein